MIIEKISAATRLWASICIRANRIMFGEDKGDVYLIDLENSEHNKIAYPTGTPAGEGGIWLYWYSVATEGDIAIAGQNAGRLYISEDFGITWNDRSPNSGNRNYLAATIKTVNDITTIIVGDNQGIYKSTDLGLTWDRLDPIGDEYSFGKFYSIDVDGINYVAADCGDQSWLEGGIYTSTDRGETWIQRYPAGDIRKEWRAVAIDGNYILAGIDGGRLYLSNDKGASWNEIQPAGNIDLHWRSVAITGNKMLAGCDNGIDGVWEIGRLYLSEDYGETWEEIQPYEDTDKRWLNADGDDGNIVFAPFGGEVWRLYNETELTTISAERDSTQTAIRLYGEITEISTNITEKGFEYLVQDEEPGTEDIGIEVIKTKPAWIEFWEVGEYWAYEYEGNDVGFWDRLYNLDNDNKGWGKSTIWWFRAICKDTEENKFTASTWMKNVPTVTTGIMDNQLVLNSIPMVNAHGELTDKGANDVLWRGFRIIKEYQGNFWGADFYIGIVFGDFNVMEKMESHTILGPGNTIVDYYWTGIFYRDSFWPKSQTPGNFEVGVYDNTIGGGILGEGFGIHLKQNDTYLIQAIAKNELGCGFGEQVSITTLAGTFIDVDDEKIDSDKFEKTVTLGTVPSGCEVIRIGIRLGRTTGCNELHYFLDGSWGSGESVTFMVELEPNSTYYIMPYIVIDYGGYEEEILGMMNYTDPDMEADYLAKYPPEVTADIDEENIPTTNAQSGQGNYSYRSINKEITCEKIGNQGLIDYYGRRRAYTVNNHLIQSKDVCCVIISNYLDKFQKLKLKVAIDIDMPIPFEERDVILLGDGKTLFKADTQGTVLFKADGEGVLKQQPFILAKIRKLGATYQSGTETILNVELEV